MTIRQKLMTGRRTFGGKGEHLKNLIGSCRTVCIFKMELWRQVGRGGVVIGAVTMAAPIEGLTNSGA